MQTYNDNCNKEKIVNEIIEDIKTTKNMRALCRIKEILEYELPLHIRDYIDEYWSGYTEGFRDDLEHEVRKFWIKTGPGCKPEGFLIAPIGTDIPNNWTEIVISGLHADEWVREQGTSFNPVDIACILFDIYMGKIYFTFKRNNE